MRGVFMPVSALTGSRLRERRGALVLRQGGLAATAGGLGSHLNLIEHNRRRISENLLEQLAQALGQPVAMFHEGVGGAVLEGLRAAAAEVPGAEVDRIEDFAGRYPGWAGVVTSLQQRAAGLQRALEAMNDRMSHDPHLSASFHEVLSAVSSVRSTAAILADTEDIEPEWRARFHRNLHQDSERLALGAEALVSYLDTAGQADEQGIASPQEEVEAWLAAADWRVLDDGAGLASGAARGMGRDLGAGVGAGAGAEGGLVVCDASGTLTFRKPVAGFALPRFGAACPLWPLFAALGQPMRPIETVIETAGPQGRRFLVRAFCRLRFPGGFRGPELREAAMLILPDHARTGEALAVGSTCRVCQRLQCPARREPSILTA